MVSPALADPSGTGPIQRAFAKDLQRRFLRLANALYNLVAVEDAFGLAKITTNTRWKFATAADKMKAFDTWLDGQIKAGVLSEDGNGGNTATGAKYVRSAYRTGIVNTFRKIRKQEQKGKMTPVTGYAGSEDQFLKDTFDASESVQKMQLLGTRVYSALKDVSSTMDAKITRILSQGIADGKNPRELGRQLQKEVSSLGKVRANRIARTEIIHAHAEAQLDAFDALQVEQIQVMAEWSTAGDDKVCPMCNELTGVVLTPKEARGLLPRHPNCRCSWVPADVGESTKGQQRSKEAVQGAINRSVKMEHPKKSMADAFDMSKWAGADLKVDTRPKPIKDLPLFAPSPNLWGQQPTAVMRWMGQDGWSVEDANRVLVEMGEPSNMATIRTQVNAGKKGLRGAPAALTDEQIAILRSKRAGGTIIPPTPPVIKPVVPPPIIPPIPKPVVPPVVPPIIPPTLPDIKDIKTTGTSLIRLLGKEGFDFKDARSIADELGLKLSDATLKTQLAAGRKGLRGEVAKLTDAQLTALRAWKGTGIITPKPPTIKVTPPPKPIIPVKQVKPYEYVPRPRKIITEDTSHVLESYLQEDTELNAVVAEVTKLGEEAEVLRNEMERRLQGLLMEIATKENDARAAAVRWLKETDADAYRSALERGRSVGTEAVSRLNNMENPPKDLAKMFTDLESVRSERWKLEKKLSTHAEDLRKEIDKVLDIDKAHRKGINLEMEKGRDNRRATVKEAADWIERKLARRPEDTEGDKVYVKLTKNETSRAFASPGENTITLKANEKHKTAVHEIGHIVEYRVQRHSQGTQKNMGKIFRDMRIRDADTEEVYLSEQFPANGYGKMETGNEDHFGRYFGKGNTSAFYCGKSYDRGEDLEMQTQPTEVISMGLEAMYHDPAGLAKADPEYFKFLVGFLRGHY